MERAIRDLIGEHGERALEIMWGIAQGKPMPLHGVIEAEGFVSSDRVPTLELQASAARWLHERAFGKAASLIEVSGPETSPRTVDTAQLGADDLQTLLALVVRTGALPPGAPSPSDTPTEGAIVAPEPAGEVRAGTPEEKP